MAKFTITDAERIAAKPKPWTIRLECQAGGSNKYWYATGRSLTEAVECGWGAIGAVPQLKLISWTDLRVKVAEKLNKGYTYADTPYIRMSPGSLAALAGVPQQLPVLSPPPVVPVVLAPPMSPVPASLVALGTPYDQIVKLKLLRTGVKVTGYAAVDKDGNTVMDFSKDAGPDFATQHGLEIDFI